MSARLPEPNHERRALLTGAGGPAQMLAVSLRVGRIPRPVWLVPPSAVNDPAATRYNMTARSSPRGAAECNTSDVRCERTPPRSGRGSRVGRAPLVEQVPGPYSLGHVLGLRVVDAAVLELDHRVDALAAQALEVLALASANRRDTQRNVSSTGADSYNGA